MFMKHYKEDLIKLIKSNLLICSQMLAYTYITVKNLLKLIMLRDKTHIYRKIIFENSNLDPFKFGILNSNLNIIFYLFL